jgi:HAD superfamily hydrolase (TIGR01509 family)
MTKKAIIFDCFGVLIVSKRDLLVEDFPDKQTEFKDLSVRSDYGFIDRTEYDEAVADLTGMDIATFQDKYWNGRARNQAALDWAQQLRDQGYKVGLLSNISTWRMNDFFTSDELNSMFDEVVLSGEVGLIKPSPEIFELTAAKLGVKPEDCIMIDDILENVDGAQAIGMKTILFGDTNQARADFELIESSEVA